MITDKEYPATHSMSTAWYMVDADGNVGLMEFEDNGPVPEFNHVPLDLSLSDLVFGQGFSNNGTCKGIHLNVSQILELLGQPQNPKDVEQWYDVCLAIAEECTPEFLALCKNKDITNNGCVSHEMNLFSVEVCRCISSKNNNIIEGSTLDKMIRANMIKAIYQMPELNVDSEYNEDTKSVEFTNDFDNSPYYIYCQSYWTSDPQHRMNIPSNPVKITQIDEKYHKRLLHVPVRFNNAEDMQIAQWFVCDTEGPKLLIDNAGYSLLPIDSNTKKYCLTRPFLFDFYRYCPDSEHYSCKKCDHECADTTRIIKSLTPTILYVIAPTRKDDALYRLGLPKEIKDKIAVFSYIPKFPYRDNGYWMDIDLANKQLTVEALTALLSSSRNWFEWVVETIKPQIIIIDNEALPVFSSVFPINNHEVLINNITYPIFEASSIKENLSHIFALAQLPYRGKIFKMAYTEQEVDALKRQDKVAELEW